MSLVPWLVERALSFPRIDPEQSIPDSMKELRRRLDDDRLREAVVGPESCLQARQGNGPEG
jgi:hypothetical protein